MSRNSTEAVSWTNRSYFRNPWKFISSLSFVNMSFLRLGMGQGKILVWLLDWVGLIKREVSCYFQNFKCSKQFDFSVLRIGRRGSGMSYELWAGFFTFIKKSKWKGDGENYWFCYFIGIRENLQKLIRYKSLEAGYFRNVHF